MSIKKREAKIKPKAKAKTMAQWMLNQRGIPDSIRETFFEPSEYDLIDSFELYNMDKVVERIKIAIDNGEIIYVYGDVDIDGSTATAIPVLYFSNLSTNIRYIFHQRSQGHGVIVDNVPDDCDLLIIVDSSTNSTEECKVLSKRCDVIVLDHHHKYQDNPYCTLVNCTLHDYPNSSLCGAQLSLKMVQAYDKKYGYDHATQYYDLAMAGTIGDMMDLSVLENRFIVSTGLYLLDSGNGNLGLKTLYKRLQGTTAPTAESIAFYVAPCINSIIRMSDIYLTMELFTCTDEVECDRIVDKIIEINNERKELTDSIFKYIIANNMINDDKVILVNMSGAGYSRNIYGLVANKISQEYNRPCLFGEVDDEGNFKGSGRSPSDDVDFRNDLCESGLGEGFGHSSAFGGYFKFNNKDKLLAHFNELYKDKFLDKYYYYDAVVPFNRLTMDFLERIEKISRITGHGFERPKFLIENLNIKWYNKIGEKKNHTKLVTRDSESYFNIMKFNTEELLTKYQQAKSINAIGSVSINRYYSEEKQQWYISKQMFTDLITCN